MVKGFGALGGLPVVSSGWQCQAMLLVVSISSLITEVWQPPSDMSHKCLRQYSRGQWA